VRKSLGVPSVVVAAAKLKVKRAVARGLPVDPATQAIAKARPLPVRSGTPEDSVGNAAGRVDQHR